MSDERRQAAPGSVAAPIACAVLAEAASRGVDPVPLFALLGLPPQAARDPERKVAAQALFDVWAACMRKLRDPGLPLRTAARLSLADYQVLGFAAMTSPSTRAALGLAVRYSGIVLEGARWTATERTGDETVRLLWLREGPRTLGQRTANECAVAELLHALRQILGTRVVPVQVAFRHPAPAQTQEHARFFGVQPRFGAKWDGLELQRALLDRVPRQANPALAAFLTQQMERQLELRAPATTLAGRVAALVEQDLAAGEPEMSKVARGLALSERTLRRQLAAESTSFRGVVEALRRRRAEALLSARTATVDEVGFLLGFSETSAFARAFKRWTGLTPGEFRRRAA